MTVESQGLVVVNLRWMETQMETICALDAHGSPPHIAHSALHKYPTQSGTPNYLAPHPSLVAF